MLSASGRYKIVFNGEIYNHKDLRKEISLEEEFLMEGHSDTETLINGLIFGE